MPQGGMLGLLQFLIRNIASAIASALAPFFAAMTGSLDVLFGWAGWPGGFSQITGWIGVMIAYMVTSMGWAMTMASTMFSFMTTVVPPLLWVIPQALTTYTQMIGMVWGYFTGLAGTGFDLWNNFAGPTWVYLAILLYPLYLLDLWATKGLSHVLVHIDLWAGIIRGLIDLGLGLASWVWNFVSGLIQDIPVI
jgi:hypothetical protein